MLVAVLFSEFCVLSTFTCISPALTLGRYDLSFSTDEKMSPGWQMQFKGGGNAATCHLLVTWICHADGL